MQEKNDIGTGRHVVLDFFDSCRKNYGRHAVGGRNFHFLDYGIWYGGLLERAEKVALWLESKQAESPYVGIAVGKSVEYVACVFGCWLARKAFVPLGTDLPKERRERAVRDAGIEIEIGRTEFDEAMLLDAPDPDGSEPPKEWRFRRDWSRDDPAYAIFSSGSTGEPKGITVSHRGLPTLWRAQVEAFGLGREYFTHLFFHSENFDASVSEMLCTLMTGGDLIIPWGTPAQTAADLPRLARKGELEYADLPPSLLRTCSPEDLWEPCKLRDGSPFTQPTVVIGGETPDAAAVRRWAGKVRLVNVYGPTEATVCTSMVRCSEKWREPLIGEPIPGVEYSVRDSAGVPGQEEGELWISGDCLADGYLGRPELTCEKFPVVDGKRWYRTGDRVRKTPQGLAFAGRVDRQLKISGQLVEPAEVERAMRSVPGIEDAAVVGVGGKLAAFAVFKGRKLAPEEISAALRKSLPKFAIPSEYAAVKALPRTPSGKTDYAKLTSEASSGGFRTLARRTMDSMDYLIMLSRAETDGMGVSSERLRSRWEGFSPDDSFIGSRDLEFAEERAPLLVTGATGFLGSRVLSVLGEERPESPVFCIVRCRDALSGMERIRAAFRRYSLNESALDNVTVIPGDVSKPLLGMSERDYDYFSYQIGTVFHCAGAVDVVSSYEELELPNVVGTQNVAAFCAAGSAKRLAYASTLSVFVSTDRNSGEALESDDLSESRTVYGGYAQTKLVAEMMVRRCGKLGKLFPRIFRFGLLCGDMETGLGPRNDQMGMVVRGLVKTGTYPRDESGLLAVDVTPVDYAADAMVKIALSDGLGTSATFHVCGNKPLPYGTLAAAVSRETGICPVGWEEWLAESLRGSLADDPDVQMASLSLCRMSEENFRKFRALDLFQATGIKFGKTAENAAYGRKKSALKPDWSPELIKKYVKNFLNELKWERD